MSSIKKNFFYQSLYQLLLIFMPLITTPYVARVLGAEGSGIYAFVHNISNWFVVFAMLGLETYGNRIVARVRDDKAQLNKTFSELLTLHLIISFIIIILYLFLILFLNNEYRLFLFIQALYVLSAALDVNWLFFGLEQYKITVTRNFIIKILTVSSIFALVNSKDDLWIYCLIMSGGTLLSQTILWRYVFKFVKLEKVYLKTVIKHMKPMIILFIAVVAAHVYRMIDKAMLGVFGDMAELGCYEYADKFIRIPLSLITALGTVMVSRMSNLFAKDDSNKIEELLETSSLFVLFMSFAMAFGLAAIAPEFVFVFLGKGYEESKILIRILTITIPLIAWNNFERTQILIPLQRDAVYTRAVCGGAFVNVCLNVPLIFYLGARGAAIATIFSYFTVAWIQTRAITDKKIFNYLKYAPYFMLAGAVMFFVVRFISRYLSASLFSVIIEIIAGGCVYGIFVFLFLILFKKELLAKIMKRK